MRWRLMVLVVSVGVVLVHCGGETGDTTGAETEAAGESTMAAPTTGATTMGGASGEYTAFHVPPGGGMYTRLAVRRLSVEDGLCTTVMFTTPLDAQEGFEITTPAMWAVEYALVQQEPADCLTVYQIVSEPVGAESGQGSATWPQEQACPPTVDIDVTVVFPAEQAWAPAEVVLKAEGIAVQGC